MTSQHFKILLIEDEEDLSKLLLLRFRKAGFEADSANNGKTGLEKAISFHPDLILLDVIMPGMDGWQVCEKIKKTPDLKQTHVFMVTAAPSVELEEKAKLLGADGIIFKPFENQELMNLVSKLIEKKKTLNHPPR